MPSVTFEASLFSNLP